MKKNEIIASILASFIAANLYGLMIKSVRNIKSQNITVEYIVEDIDQEELEEINELKRILDQAHNYKNYDNYNINVLPASSVLKGGKIYYYISDYFKAKGYFLYGSRCYQVSKYYQELDKCVLEPNEEKRLDIVLKKYFQKQEIDYNGYIISIILPDMVKTSEVSGEYLVPEGYIILDGYGYKVERYKKAVYEAKTITLPDGTIVLHCEHNGLLVGKNEIVLEREVLDRKTSEIIINRYIFDNSLKLELV